MRWKVCKPDKKLIKKIKGNSKLKIQNGGFLVWSWLQDRDSCTGGFNTVAVVLFLKSDGHINLLLTYICTACIFGIYNFFLIEAFQNLNA